MTSKEKMSYNSLKNSLVGLENSRIINFPPGFKEERIDSSAAFLSVTFLRPNAIVIRSKVLSL